MSWSAGHNKMSDWTDAEYNRLMGYRPSAFPAETVASVPSEHVNAADYIDWRTLGAVTPVKD